MSKMVSLTETARSAYADRAVFFLSDRHGHHLVDRNRSGQALLPRARTVGIWPRVVAQKEHAQSDVDTAWQSFGGYGSHGSARRCALGCAAGSGTRPPGQSDLPAVRQNCFCKATRTILPMRRRSTRRRRVQACAPSVRATRRSRPSRHCTGCARHWCGIEPPRSIRSTRFCWNSA